MGIAPGNCIIRGVLDCSKQKNARLGITILGFGGGVTCLLCWAGPLSRQPTYNVNVNINMKDETTPSE